MTNSSRDLEWIQGSCVLFPHFPMKPLAYLLAHLIASNYSTQWYPILSAVTTVLRASSASCGGPQTRTASLPAYFSASRRMVFLTFGRPSYKFNPPGWALISATGEQLVMYTSNLNSLREEYRVILHDFISKLPLSCRPDHMDIGSLSSIRNILKDTLKIGKCHCDAAATNYKKNVLKSVNGSGRPVRAFGKDRQAGLGAKLSRFYNWIAQPRRKSIAWSYNKGKPGLRLNFVRLLNLTLKECGFGRRKLRGGTMRYRYTRLRIHCLAILLPWGESERMAFISIWTIKHVHEVIAPCMWF